MCRVLWGGTNKYVSGTMGWKKQIRVGYYGVEQTNTCRVLWGGTNKYVSGTMGWNKQIRVGY